MTHRISLKFLTAYLIVGFIGFFMVASLTSAMTREYILKREVNTMQKEASLIASQYMTTYFDQEGTTYTLSRQLDTVGSSTGTSIWLINTEKEVLLNAGKVIQSLNPDTIEGFSSVAFGKNGYLVGTFFDTFSEDVISVCSPVLSGYTIRGYVIIHKPVSSILSVHREIMRIIYLTFVVFYLMVLSLYGVYYYLVRRPLAKVIEAAREYASGNLSYDIPIEGSDEIGILASSLNFMASQLSEIEETQRKFISNVSHDFRSPLTSIKGYVEAMADGTIPPENQEKYLKIISFETDRLTNLTEDLLTLNNLKGRNTQLSVSQWDINRVIKETASSFEGRCESKKIEIELIFADYTTTVSADRAKIQQVLYNLLDNAIKFSDRETTITIETTIRGNKLFTSVKDEGVGIPKESLDKIWERFYKTDASRGKDKTGTGLGLAIVKEIIQAHDERIDVVSTEGVGTEFIFSLPLARG